MIFINKFNNLQFTKSNKIKINQKLKTAKKEIK